MIPSGNFAISGEQHGMTSTLRLQGELDVCSRDRLCAAISIAFNRGPQMLVLDLSELEFMDCSGLAVLMWADKLLAENSGQLFIVGCRPTVRRLMRLTGSDQQLHLCSGDSPQPTCGRRG